MLIFMISMETNISTHISMDTNIYIPHSFDSIKKSHCHSQKNIKEKSPFDLVI
jgi:hypothetical protein